MDYNSAITKSLRIYSYVEYKSEYKSEYKNGWV